MHIILCPWQAISETPWLSEMNESSIEIEDIDVLSRSYKAGGGPMHA